jgi:hypothetical protein
MQLSIVRLAQEPGRPERLRSFIPRADEENSMRILFQPMPASEARAFQRGGLDANGQPPERKFSDGGGVPCRHCLRLVPRDRPYLVLAYRPFRTIQPYSEVGPVFLCAEECAAGGTSDQLPAFLVSGHYIVRGYDADERIVYGTGQVTPTSEIIAYGRHLLDRPDIAFAHVRSATNNCYHVRIERADPAVR